MHTLNRLASGLSSLTICIGRLSSWCFLLLVLVITFDVVTRRFFVLGSTKLQELEWHLHAFLFCMTLGFGYIKDAHVRVDLFRERLSPRIKASIEVVGILVLLLPFLGTMIFYGADFAYRAYVEGEVSAAGTGLSHRWLIKAVIPIGLAVLSIAAVARFLQALCVLCGRSEQI